MIRGEGMGEGMGEGGEGGKEEKEVVYLLEIVLVFGQDGFGVHEDQAQLRRLHQLQLQFCIIPIFIILINKLERRKQRGEERRERGDKRH